MAETNGEIAKLISQYKSNPLLPLELPLIVEKLGSKNPSVLGFKKLYFRDPLFCAYVIDLAWHKTENKENHPIAADHAMNTVGIDGVKNYLDSISTVNPRTNSKEVLSDEVRFSLTSSLLAAELAKQLSGNKPKSNALYWASLAHQFPDTLLWHLKPKPMWRIQYRQIKLPKKLAVFEQAKLGFELIEWRQAVAKEWHLSEFNQLTFAKSPLFGRKELLNYAANGYSEQCEGLKDWIDCDSWLVLTANWLAKAILAPWFANSYRHYFMVAQHAFRLSDKKTNAAIVAALRETSQHLHDSRLLVPAAAFLNLKSKPHYPEWLNSAPKIPLQRNKKFAEQGKLLKQSTQNLAVRKLIKELIETPEKFANINQLLKVVLDSCLNNLQYSRVSLLLIDWNGKKVKTSICLNSKNSEKIRPDFTIEPNAPLKKFLSNQGFLYFDIQKHSKIWHRLPKAINDQQVKGFVMFSLKPKTQVKALIYLDTKGEAIPSVETIKLTKQLLNAANSALAGAGKK